MRSSRRKLGIIAASALVALGLVIVPAATAQAGSATVSGAVTADPHRSQLSKYSTYRYHVSGAASMTSVSYPHCMDLYLGLRNEAGTQVTQTASKFVWGAGHDFYMPSGSTTIPGATYYAINASDDNDVAGSAYTVYCPDGTQVTWSGVFTY